MTNFNDQYSVHMFPNKQLVDKVIDHKGEVLLQNHSQRFGFYHRLRSHRRVERGLFYHFIYAYMCLFTLARIKISKSNQYLLL